jgi:hypothetical protein
LICYSFTVNTVIFNLGAIMKIFISLLTLKICSLFFGIALAEGGSGNKAQNDEQGLLKLYGVTSLWDVPPGPLPKSWPPGQSVDTFLGFWSDLKKFGQLTESVNQIDATVKRKESEVSKIQFYMPSAQFDLLLQREQAAKISKLQHEIKNDKIVQKYLHEDLSKFKRSKAYQNMRNFEMPKSYLETLLLRKLTKAEKLALQETMGAMIRCAEIFRAN